MLKNIFKTAIRNFSRNKAYSLINISGLAIGLSCCILIILYIQREVSYDKFHEKADRIGRVIVEYEFQGEGSKQLSTPSIVAPLFQREFPEIERTVRFYPPWRSAVVRYNQKVFQEDRFYFADSAVFEIFTFPFVAGDPATALNRPNTIVITESTARKYFGDENPIGKTLQRENDWPFEVTGVLQDLPDNSHIKLDFLASYASLPFNWAKNETWNSANFRTYLLFKTPQSRASLESKLPDLIQRERGEQLAASGTTVKLHIQPLTRIHLHSQLRGETNGDIANVYAFSAIAVLILLIACINYMNFATARSAQRGREVGMRKVLGAFRSHISWQFFAESAITTTIAFVLAVILAEILLPFFNEMFGETLRLELLNNNFLLIALFAVGIIVSLISGSYPALILSRFQPVNVLRGSGSKQASRTSFRDKLVVFQFLVSIALIAAAFVVHDQLQFVRQKKLGFDKEHVLALPMSDSVLRQKKETLISELTRHENVLSASAVDGYPSRLSAGYRLAAEGLNEDQYPLAGGMAADKNVLKTLGIELIAGQGFPENYVPEQGYFYVINEALLKQIGWNADDAIGKWVNLLGNRQGILVGVARDFHFTSLHQEIQPLAMFLSPKQNDYTYLLVKIAPGNPQETLTFIEQKWREAAPHRPFAFSFLDDQFDALYRADARIGQLLVSFSGLAIFVACLGLFGLAAFAAEKRTKEIGVRKVLGATTANVVALLSKDFVKLVLIANIIAVPLTWYAMNNWLQEFAYRIELGWGVFALAGGLTLFIALFTVSFQAIRAALANPIQSLHYE